MAAKRILIVDDEGPWRALLQHFLGSCGYETAGAADGLEGFEKVLAFKPDLVLVDLHMPKMGGIGLCGLVKKDPKTAHIKVLFLSGEGRLGPAEDALQEGADGYLTKPVDFPRLKAKLEKLLQT